MKINDIYLNILKILKNESNFIIKNVQTGGASINVIQPYLKNISDKSVLKYCNLVSIFCNIKELYNSDLLYNISDLLQVEINADNIDEINNKLWQNIKDLIVNNLYELVSINNDIIYNDILSFDKFCNDNNLVLYLDNIITNFDCELYELFNILKGLIFINKNYPDLYDMKYLYQILLIILNTYTTDLINDPNNDPNNDQINKYVQNLNLLYQLMKFNIEQADTIITEDLMINYTLVFNISEQIKYYNLVLFNTINKFGINDQILSKLTNIIKNELIIDNNNYEQIINDINEFLLDETNFKFTINNKDFKFKDFYNLFIQNNILEIDLSKLLYKTRINETKIATLYLKWYRPTKTDFNRLIITDLYIKDIYIYFLNNLTILHEMNYIQFKQLLLWFRKSNDIFKFLIKLIKFDIYVDLNNLYEPFFYVIETKYKHFYLKDDILFLKQFVPNIVYLNPDSKYIYFYFKTHGALQYLKNNNILNTIQFKEETEEYIIINNIKVKPFNANNIYLYIINETYYLDNKNTSPNLMKKIYGNYLELKKQYILIEENKPIYEIVYDYIVNFYNFINNNNKSVLEYNYFVNLLEQTSIDLSKLSNLWELFHFNDEIKIKIAEYIDLDEYETIYKRLYNNIEEEIKEYNEDIIKNNDLIKENNNNIVQYNDLINDLNNKITLNKEKYATLLKLKSLKFNLEDPDTYLQNITAKLNKIKDENNYDDFMNKFEIKTSIFNNLEADKEKHITHNNDLINKLKEYYLESLNEFNSLLISDEKYDVIRDFINNNSLTNIDKLDNNEFTDELLSNLFKLSTLKISKQESEASAFAEYNTRENETPFSIITILLDEINSNKLILNEIIKKIDDINIELKELNFELNKIEKKLADLKLEILEINLLEKDIKLAQENLYNTEILMAKYETKLDQLYKIKNDEYKILEAKNIELEMLMKQSIIMKEKLHIENHSKLNSYINLKIQDLDPITFKELEQEINMLLKKNNTEEILINKIINRFVNLRIIYVNIETQSLIKYYENDLCNNEFGINIYIGLINNKKYYINIIDFINLVKSNTNVFYNLQDIYLELNKKHTINKNNNFIKNDNNKLIKSMNKFLKSTNINLITESDDKINIMIKILDLLKIQYIFIFDNPEVYNTWYKLVFYYIIKYKNDYSNKTIKKIKYNIILLILLNQSNTYTFKILNQLYIYELFIYLFGLNNDQIGLIDLGNITYDNKSYSIIDQYNSVVGTYNTIETIDGDYRNEIEKHFRNYEGLIEIENSFKLKAIKIYDKNKVLLKPLELYIQIATEFIYMSLYDNDYDYLGIYPLNQIKEYYEERIFPRNNMENLNKEIKWAFVRAEYNQVYKIMKLCNIEFMNDFEGFFIQYLKILDCLYKNYNVFKSKKDEEKILADPDSFYKITGFTYIENIINNK